MKKSKPESTALSANQMYSDFKENVNMADCISELIEEILDLTSLENASPTGSEVGIFNAKKSPKISIKQYLRRFQKYTLFSEEVFVFALIYIDRVMFSFPHMTLSPANVHRLLLSSVIIAAKQHQDQLESQEHLARVAGISQEQLMKLELSLLEMLEWRTHVDQKQFLMYIENLAERNHSRLNPAEITEQALEDLKKNQKNQKVRISEVSTLESSSESAKSQKIHKPRSYSVPYTQEDVDELESLINQVSQVFFS